MISNRKTSTITDVKGFKDKHGSVAGGGKANINTSSIDGATGSQVNFNILTFVMVFAVNITLIEYS